MAYISRDPYAREELHREQVEGDKLGCTWCGSLNKRGKLFMYYTERDSIFVRRNYIKGVFCCIGCMRAYHS